MRRQLVKHKLVVVIAIAIMARLGALVAFPSVFAFSQPGGEIHGSVAYDVYARNLLETGVYGREPGAPDSVLPPLYSATLALIYAVFGRSYVAVGFIHTLFDVCAIALLYDIARRLFPGRRGDWTGTLGGLCFALYPYLIFQNLTLNDTALWILLLHLFVWLMILLRGQDGVNRRSFALSTAAGFVLGLSALARALLPPLALLMALWFLFRLSWRQTLLRLLPVALVSALVLLPWLLRGAAIHGGFVAVALNGGENLYQGNNPQTVPIFRAGYDAQWSSRPPDAPPVADPYLNNQVLLNAGLRYLRDNPGRIPELLWVKLWVYWNPQVRPLRNLREGEVLRVGADGVVQIISGGQSHTGVSAANAAYEDDSLFALVGRSLHLGYFGGLWLLAMVGAVLAWRDWRDASLLFFVQISQTAAYLLFHPSTRYRSPTDPLLFVFSALALVWLWDRRRGRLNS